MNARRLFAAPLALALLGTAVTAQPPLPVLDDKPVPQVDARGATAAVMALTFSADGQTLYAAGLDKAVRVWGRRQGRFVLERTYHVPIGIGNAGAVNAVALSPDGAWLAVAGRAPMRGEAGFRSTDVYVEAGALSEEQNKDVGVIYVARTANPAGGKVLRGHRGGVRALAFLPAAKGKPPLLVSAGVDRDGAKLYGTLRLWDVAAGGKPLAEVTDPRTAQRKDRLQPVSTRPGLAAWHTGPGPRDVRVAVAWPEKAPEEKDADKPGYLRLWDASPGADPWQRWENDAYGWTAALLDQDGGAARVLLGGAEEKGGRLRAFRFNADRDTRGSSEVAATFPPSDGTHFLPAALAVVPGRDGGAPAYAAVVLQPSGKGGDFRLALVDLSKGRVAAAVPLAGSDWTQLPALAASATHIAVAATRDHAVRVYAVADLSKGKEGLEADLTGDALAPRQVAFADQGRRLRLDGMLFDLEKRQLVENGRAADDAPDMGQWAVARDGDRKGVTVRQGQKNMPGVRLKGADEFVTAQALRPPAQGRPGVLAVAYTERDAARTVIMLCDPTDGRPYRMLYGHLLDVQGLAFSAARPLLASVADDQTVCVWSLADLDRAVGAVPGLGVGEDGKKVVVRRVEKGSPAAEAGLKVDDVLEKLGVPGGEAKPVTSAAAFLLDVSARKPGDQVEVTVGGKAVRLPLERGVDVRKPLFSLLLLRSKGGPEWVGWSPAGPYDASGPAAEAHLGWHTNTGDPAAPVSYLPAREHQKDFYREGILGYLAAEADLSRALRKWDADHPVKESQPALSPRRPDNAQPTERADTFLLREALAAFVVGINEDYALDDKHVLRWRLTRADGGAVKGGAAALTGEAGRDGRTWRAAVAPWWRGVAWRRGEYQLRFGLHARADGPELTAETVTLRFRPPPPTLALLVGGEAVKTTEQKPREEKQNRLPLQVKLEAPQGQQVEVRFALARNGKPQKDAPPDREETAGTFEQPIDLQEGLNRVTVRAVNKGALKGQEDDEAAEAVVWVAFKKAKDELPPRFTGLRLDPEPEPTRLKGRIVWVIDRPAARLTGKIEAAADLTQAEWSAGEAPPKSLLPARAASEADFSIDLKDLPRGEVVTVRLRAKTATSDEGTIERDVAFFPALPGVQTDKVMLTGTADAVKDQDVLSDKVTLTGTLQAAPPASFEGGRLSFRVTADGKSQSFKPDVNEKAGTWKADLTLFPGVNTVEAVVGNKWRAQRAVEGTLQLRYRRPPEITKAPAEKEAVETNKVALDVTVEGPKDRPLRAVTSDGRPVLFEAGEPAVKGERWVWKVKLPEVFVNDGESNLGKVSIRAATDEGESKAAVVKIVHKMLPHPPVARFLSPTAADTARRPEYKVTLRVESEKELERVEIKRGDEVLRVVDLKKATKEGKLHVLQSEEEVTLRSGPNVLEVVAVNKDGRSPRVLAAVSLPDPGVLVSVDRVEVMAPNGDVGEVLTPDPRSDGSIVFPQVKNSLAWLVGRVRWSDPQAKALDDTGLEVVVRVGDVRQFPVALGRRGRGAEANTRPFRVPVVLIGADNRVQIDVPTVGQEAVSRRELRLACAAPADKQRLHVLVVGVNVKDVAELKKRVLDALDVSPTARPEGSQGEFFKKPPFERCVLYHVLAGEVDRGKVEAQLVEINNEIVRLKKATGYLNDVVLIYYQGEDVLVPEKKERWLKTSRNYQFANQPTEKFAIPCHALPRVPGAQLLLLNVAGPPDSQASQPDSGVPQDVGLMRYACNDPSEMRTADPKLLGMMQKAVREKGQLGAVASEVNQLAGQSKKYGSPLVKLDEDQARRVFGGPGR
jgi:hypothetical protein